MRDCSSILCAVVLIGAGACSSPGKQSPLLGPPERDGNVVITEPPPPAGSASVRVPEAASVETVPEATKPPPRAGNVDLDVRTAPPDNFQCDGALGEWGPLVPGSQAASSRLALSFGSDKMLVAGDFPSSTDGVWIELVFPHFEFPIPALHDRGSGSMVPLDCDVVISSSEVFPKGGLTGFYRYKIGVIAAAQPACRRLMRKNEALGRTYEARFRKLFRVDDGGVRSMDAANALVPVTSASSRWVRRGDRVHFEVALPNLVLPRAAETPMRSVELSVLDAPESAPPASGAQQRVSLDIGEVRFEPGTAVREIFRDDLSNVIFRTIAYSYQPGEGLTFEELTLCEEEGLPSVCERRGVLSKPGGPSLGRVQIHPGDRGNVLFVDGKPVSILQGQVVPRGGALHVFEEQVSFDDDGGAKYHAAWGVSMVDGAGVLRTADLPTLVCAPNFPEANCCHAAVRPKAGGCVPNLFHNADYSEIGIRGRGWLDNVEVTELRWRWDASKSEYVMKVLPASAAK